MEFQYKKTKTKSIYHSIYLYTYLRPDQHQYFPFQHSEIVFATPVWHQQDAIFEVELRTLAGRLHHVCMPKCIKYLPCDWLIRYLF